MYFFHPSLKFPSEKRINQTKKGKNKELEE